MTQRALVTGAGGFVGRHLIEYLASQGDEVVATDRANDGVDILDPGGVCELVGEVQPDVIYHLAGQADVAASWGHPLATFRVNAEGTLNVLTAAADARTARVVTVTSAEVYGHVTPAQLPVTEEQPLHPTSPYAASKAAAEMVAIQFASAGLGVIRARAFNHLGPGQSERFVAAALAGRLVRAEQTGDSAIAVGNLEARRDFTDVRDVVRAYRALATDGEPGQAYNVCSGVDHSIADLADLILERMGTSIDLTPDPDLQRPSDVPALRGDHTKITTTTGWEPRIPLETTIDDIIDHVRRNTVGFHGTLD